jgi:signal transduction histidine kinase
MNLLSNAKDAVMDSEKKEITINVAFNEVLIIKVKDTGVGIPSSIIDKIFDPFFTTKEINKGTGIGLSLVYNYLKEMNGGIEVLSELGQGSEFILRFPRAEVLVENHSEEVAPQLKNTKPFSA